MSLPKIDVPVYELVLPSNKKKISFRPFLVKEQKLFLIANESNELSEKIKIIKQVLSNCVVQPVDIDVDSLAIMDIEYLFLNLRARSVSEMVDIEFECNNVVDGKKCGHVNPLKFNLLEAKLTESEPLEKMTNIRLTEKIGVMMKFPNFEATQKLVNNEKINDTDLIISCIDYIYDSDELHYTKDTPKKDMVEWLESLSTGSYMKLKAFFDKIPRVQIKNEFVCGKCGYKEDMVLEGLESFFG